MKKRGTFSVLNHKQKLKFMKKLFKGTIVLIAIGLLFSAASSLTSCTKASAQSSSVITNNTAIIFIKTVYQDSVYVNQVWTMDRTGANIHQVMISTDYNVNSILPISDNVSVFFIAKLNGSTIDQMYKCDMSGNNVTAVTNEPSTTVQMNF